MMMRVWLPSRLVRIKLFVRTGRCRPDRGISVLGKILPEDL